MQYYSTTIEFCAAQAQFNYAQAAYVAVAAFKCCKITTFLWLYV